MLLLAHQALLYQVCKLLSTCSLFQPQKLSESHGEGPNFLLWIRSSCRTSLSTIAYLITLASNFLVTMPGEKYDPTGMLHARNLLSIWNLLLMQQFDSGLPLH